MKRILQHCNSRHGYDGWALKMGHNNHILNWSFSTTRQEVRELRDALPKDMFNITTIVKVKINMQIVT